MEHLFLDTSLNSANDCLLVLVHIEFPLADLSTVNFSYLLELWLFKLLKDLFYKYSEKAGAHVLYSECIKNLSAYLLV